jgi:hypothetical protein
MSLQIRINGMLVDVASKSKLLMDLRNPHLIYDGIPENTIKAPIFPDSSRNRQVFGWWEEPQSGGRVPEFLWEHYFNGELIRQGYYYLKEAALKRGYIGDFDDKIDRFFGDFQYKKLTEIDFGTLPLVATPTHADLGMLAYCRPSIVNADFFGTNGVSANYSGKMNDYANGAYLSNSPAVPMFFIPYLFKKIGQITGTTIEGSFLTHNTWKNLLLFNTRSLDVATDIVVNRHLPDLTLMELFVELRKLPNLKFDFNSVEKKLKIDFWEDDLAQPAELDWSNKAVKGEVKKPEMSPRLQLGYELDGGDGLMKDKPTIVADYVSPTYNNSVYDGIAVLKSKFSTILKDDATNLGIIKQVGISDQFAQSANKFAPRLAFWHGVVDNYPRALPSLNGTDLYWTGPNGLASKSWKRTEEMRSQQFYLLKSFSLNETDLAKLNFSKKIHCRGMNYLAGQISIENPITAPASCLLVGGV